MSAPFRAPRVPQQITLVGCDQARVCSDAYWSTLTDAFELDDETDEELAEIGFFGLIAGAAAAIGGAVASAGATAGAVAGTVSAAAGSVAATAGAAGGIASAAGGAISAGVQLAGAVDGAVKTAQALDAANTQAAAAAKAGRKLEATRIRNAALQKMAEVILRAREGDVQAQRIVASYKILGDEFATKGKVVEKSFNLFKGTMLAKAIVEKAAKIARAIKWKFYQDALAIAKKSKRWRKKPAPDKVNFPTWKKRADALIAAKVKAQAQKIARLESAPGAQGMLVMPGGVIVRGRWRPGDSTTISRIRGKGKRIKAAKSRKLSAKARKRLPALLKPKR